MIFQNLRKHTKTIMWVIAIFIVPAFVIWNIGSAVKNRRSGFAGKIFNKKISWQEFSGAKHAARNEAIMRYGENFDQSTNLDEQAWTRLILIKKAKQKNIKVADQELLNHIKNLPFFQYADLNSENYAMITSRLFQQTPAEFEDSIRNSLLIAKLMDQLSVDITASDDEIKNEYLIKYQQASASYIIISPDSFLESAALDNENEIKNYYENHKEELKTQEQVNVKYIEIKFEKFKNGIQISDERISKYYENNKPDFKKEQSPAETAAPAAESTDPAAKTAAPAAEPAPSAAQSMYKDLSEVKDSIRERLIEKEMNNRAEDTARKILNKLYSSNDFQAIAQEYGVNADETGQFSMLKEIPKVGLSFPFIKAAFSLKTGEVSEIIKTPTALYILMPIKKFPPAIPSYEDAKEKVTQSYRYEQARILAAQKAEAIRKEIINLITNNKTFTDAAKELGLEIKHSTNVTRDGYINELGFVPNFSQTVFNLKPQEISGVVDTPKGFCVIQTLEVSAINNEEYEKEKENFRNIVLSGKKNQFLSSWFEKVKEEAKPESYLEDNKTQTE